VRRRLAIEANEYQARFAPSLVRKDGDLLAEASNDGELRILQAARTWLADAVAAGRGRDYSAVLAQILGANAPQARRAAEKPRT
jgi:hypothetical protein